MKTLLCLFTVLASATTAAPADTMPTRWSAPSDTLYTLTPPAADGWWNRFSDPVLTGLIERGEKNNYDVAMAMRRIALAQNQIDADRSALYPTVEVSGGYTLAQPSGRTGKHKTKMPVQSYFSLGAQVNWEVDVFGRVEAQLKAGRAAADVSRADRDAAMVSMAAGIGKAYVQLRLAQARLEMVRQQMEMQQKILHITEVRKETGLSSGLDVSQATTVVLTTKAQIPALQQQVRTQINNIAVLTGEYPSAIAPMLEKDAPIPQARGAAAVGMPADMLNRRPDVMQARAQIAVAAANLGIAEKDYLPVLELTGSLGTDSRRFDRLFTGGSYTWQVAPQISWTVFDGYARKYRNAAARLDLENSIDQYNLTLVTAYAEVENAMSAYTAAMQQIEAEEALLKQAERTFTLSLDLYKQGLSAFTDVMNAQISRLDSQNALLEARAAADTALISLYQALGGGWQ